MGESQDLICKATGFKAEEIKIAWTRNTVRIFPAQLENLSMIRTNKLSLKNIQETDAGKYTCTITFGDDEESAVSKEVHISVTGIQSIISYMCSVLHMLISSRIIRQKFRNCVI